MMEDLLEKASGKAMPCPFTPHFLLLLFREANACPPISWFSPSLLPRAIILLRKRYGA